MTRFYDEALAETGLRVNAYSLLSTLDRLGTPLVGELAKAQAMDRTTLTRVLNPLVAQGYARLRVGADRRRRHIELTARGRRALERAYPVWRSAQQRFTESFGRRAASDLVSLCGASLGIESAAQ